MSEEVKEIILVGGSKDGTIAENDSNTKAINNIVLNEAGDAPEYIDLYLPTNVTDKEGRPIYAHIGRYDAEESASYWETLSEDEKKALKEANEAAKEFVEEGEAKEDAENTDENSEESTDESTTEASDESTSDDEETSEEETSEETTESTDSKEENDEVTEVEEESSEETKEEA